MNAPARDKDAVLVVLPYGMCFRNVVMNEELWGCLTRSFHVDVLTDLEVRDPGAIGVRHVFSLAGEGPFARFARRSNYAAVACLRLLDATRFFARADLGGVWTSNYRVLETAAKRARLLAFGALRELEHVWGVSWIIRLINLCPLCYPTLSILRRHRYRFVMLGHNNENLCILVARCANRLGIPVVCQLMGIDNMLHGLLEFTPALLLLWGREQEREFQDFQIPLKPELASTRRAIVGGLTYDNYLRVAGTPAGSREAFLREYDIAEDEDVVLFPTHYARYLPGQIELCTVVAEFFVRERVRATLLIRLRPGIDQTDWRTFAAKYPGVVKLQVPIGAAFDKTSLQPYFDQTEGIRDIELFVRTLRSSSLLILPSLSTMYLDALLFGVPSLVAMYNFASPGSLVPHRDIKSYVDMTVLDPTLGRLVAAKSQDELLAFLRRFFIERVREDRIPDEVFEFQAASSKDGRSGERAWRAIEALLDTAPGTVQAGRPERAAL